MYHTGIPKVMLGRTNEAMIGIKITPGGENKKVSGLQGNVMVE